MRALVLFAALALVAAPVLVTPTAAYADGIERPRQPRPRPRPRPPAPPVEQPREVIEVAPLPRGPEAVTLDNAFFAASSGGVGADIGGGSYSSTTVIIRGGRAHASAFAFASARASAGAHGFGGHGGGCGCR